MPPSITDRIAGLDWERLGAQLDADGFVQTPAVLRAEECRRLAASFDDDERFRSTIIMSRHRFGEGCYRYFAAPLPEPIAEARAAFYPPLAALANRWGDALGDNGGGYPARLEEFLARCHRAGQTRPTPLVLRYGPGGHNALHQDVYGDVAFPLQAVTMLSRPGADFDGGQFVLVEQRPRAQSRAHVIDLQRGAFLLFPTRHRPVRGARGHYRVAMRHGVATVRSGQRVTLGLIFHDAR
jgi:hypothetical protein